MKKKQSSRDENPKRSCDPVSEIEIDPFEDRSWVIVKKQRVTILLPPLPVSEGCLVQDAGGREALDGAAEGGTWARNGHPLGVSPSSDPSLKEIVSSEKVDELSILRTDRPMKALSPFRKINRRSRAGGPHASRSRVEPLDQKDTPAAHTTLIGNFWLQTHGPSWVPPANKNEASRDFDEYSTPGINRTKLVQRTPMNFIQRDIDGGLCVLTDRPELLRRQLRARNLKRKLEEAGGLVSWLLSMGLVQFVKIFEHKPAIEFQLAALTMQKLKEMGVVAIGPRRKLMHALNCVSRPSPIATNHL
ncbi:hypothetical protein MLD38_034345 [Melastoma candidum]|uniref:Uncharacterized protein n=1 Tax=Melastoma candidum TaxID=119954 RepID=A0ACB9MBQ9_9MYRT|nr:hypothetical protein MLD38_034345 [Melastoma candidum]